MALTKVTINQTAAETVAPRKFEVLRKLKNIKTASSIKGTINVTAAYSDSLSDLRTSFPNLAVNAGRTLTEIIPEDNAVKNLLYNGTEPIIANRYSTYEASILTSLGGFDTES